MKRESFIVLIVVLSIFISACQNTGQKDQQSLGIFIGGNDGLDFSFKENPWFRSCFICVTR